ncbi:putative succinyldiaminopimelate transaminase DapC [Nakamurella antarctica]|uniref:Putative succinyldiaminopimelate transaminase DapC n=1 Tax=Nakamurella antarctica TaxID=1902245 RepID=A0A3G8ZP69_9ACTN|nr:pyridoxal phosphate-dependent aminotransferase [Nakamurella antarctica]AZI58928.1 putative succinyldiaminopimelate transaminase DapC [Nakamurella antarctica]
MSRARTPLVPRLQPYTSTIFAQMSALATATGSINLGQGFPDSDGPAAMLAVAERAVAGGVNQYPPGPGSLELREAIAFARKRDHGQVFDPQDEILVTVGATEAVAAAVIALCEAGDEVLTLDPSYDSYAAVIAMAGARHTSVPLRDDGAGRFAVDVNEFAAAVTDRTRLVILNTPHNPTGTVLTIEELAGIAKIAVDRDLIVLTDEVYEYLVFGDAAHTPLGTLPGMAERTLTVSSGGKSFNTTGWKIGWVCGPADLVAAVRAVKQFLTYSAGAPFQPAISYALRSESAWVATLRSGLERKRDRLCAGLAAAGFTVSVPQGGYFALADIRPLGEVDGMAFCLALPGRVGVVAVPAEVFTRQPEKWKHVVRFAFCKSDETIDEACSRLSRL